MCGIAGYWSINPWEREILAAFTDMLTHRGPDGFGYLRADQGRLGIGHRRLAIIDPGPEARQPMVSVDDRFAVVFNGEIFNFLEIRDELRSMGRAFHTDSDTEVLLHAYAQWGPDCLGRFNGMWAFALWDDRARTLFLARDRFGIKPLYLLQTGGGWAFASEPKAFAALPWADGKTGDEAVAGYVAGVTELAPGTHALLRGPAHQLTANRWWHPLEHITPIAAPYAQQVDQFRELFFDACRIRLRSDVTVGTAISGGLDSSAVLAAVFALGSDRVTRRPPDWSRAFHAWVAGTEHDELQYATATCDAVGAEPIVIDILRRCRPDDIDEYLYRTEGAALTNLPAWYLYRSMREQGVRVSLDGQGADEILAGYASDAVRILAVEGSWIRRPRRTLDLVGTTRDLLRGSPYYKLGLAELLLLPVGIPNQLTSRHPQLRYTLPAYYGDPEMVAQAKTLPPLNSILFLAVHQAIRSLLSRYDMLSMSSGLEIRMPFLDWRLVSYALSVPATSILGGGFTKRVLRDAMAPYLPPLVVRRKPKLQFQGPVKDVLLGPLKPWIDAQPAAHRDVEKARAGSASHREWRQTGAAIVAEWKAHTFPRMLGTEVRRLRAAHRADSERLMRNTVELPRRSNVSV